MTNPIPPQEFEASPVTPQGYGLAAAATIIETGEVARHLGGITLRPYNCDTGASTYGVEMCDLTPAEKTAGERGEPIDFAPMIVYAASECAPDQTEREVMDRARHTRSLHEPLLVESAFATRLLTDAGAPTVVPTLAAAIGALEEFLGEQGYNGYIHAARRWAVQAGDLNAANGGAVLRTNLQNTWVFGGGYSDTLGDTLIATGPLYMWRSTPFEQVVTVGSSGTAALNNSVYGLSERIITVGYECSIFAVTIDPTP